MDKKKSARIFLLVLVGLLFIGFIEGVWANTPTARPGENANTEEVGQAAAEFFKEFWAGVAAFVSTLFGETALGNESFTRLFMAILVAMFVHTAFGTFFGEEQKYIHWGATIAATVLAIVGLPPSFLESIRVSYGAMGATILSVIPFLIIFWFSIKTRSLTMARVTWFFFMIYYLALYFSKIYQIYLKNGGWAGVFLDSAAIVYLLAFFVGLTIFIFIVKIRWIFFQEELTGFGEELSKGIKIEKLYRHAERETNKAVADEIRKSARDLDT
jgi:hypothetical protein